MGYAIDCVESIYARRQYILHVPFPQVNNIQSTLIILENEYGDKQKQV